MSSYIVLLSAGLDSATNLFAAHGQGKVVKALTFSYGQRAANKEIFHGKALCQKLGIHHEVIDVEWFKHISTSSLTDDQKTIPQGDRVNIHDLSTSKSTAKSVWVPNRNGVFLNIAAAYADALDVPYVVPGFNLEEAQTFPDNSEEYINSLDLSFSFSTSNQVKVKCFTTQMKKVDIVKMAVMLQVPFDHIWPCYFDGDQICRTCESCLRYLNAIDESGVNVHA